MKGLFDANLFVYVDGKVRTHPGTDLASGTILRLGELSQMITFGIKFVSYDDAAM